MARYTQEQYDHARGVNILDFLRYEGYELKKSGTADYQLKLHDSLKITADGKSWYWHSKDKGGHSTIELVKELDGIGTAEAVIRLSEYAIGYSEKTAPTTTEIEKKAVEKAGEKLFQLPEKSKDTRRAFAYLTKTRGLDEDVVNKCINNGYIYESKKFHNVVFVGQSDYEGNPKHASLRGTYTSAEKPFKGDVTGSDKSYSFALPGCSDAVIVFESAIDALSHASIEKLQGKEWENPHRVTLGGQSSKSLDRFLENHPDIKKISFALDNDINGKGTDGKPRNHGQIRAESLAAKYNEDGYITDILVPQNKDINEDLKALKGLPLKEGQVEVTKPLKDDVYGKLEQGVKDVFTSEKYQEFLNTMSKFHRYSTNNCILIMSQNPTATQVAGYNAWKKEFERTVKKGEKAIYVLAPRDKKISVKERTVNKDTGEISEEIKEKVIMQYLTVPVFDVSQTEGKELPKLVSELDFNVENVADILEAIKNVAAEEGISFSFEKIGGGAKGYFSSLKNKIAIKENMSDAQNLKTAIHELAHSKLHVPERKDTADATRSEKEIQAESVAYVVSNHFGVDTSQYSFPYIATWGKDKEVSELKESLNIIKNESTKIILSLEKEIDKQRAEAEKKAQTIQGQEESLVAITGSGKAMDVLKNNISLYMETAGKGGYVKITEKDVKSANQIFYIKSSDLEKYKANIPRIYEDYLCKLFKDAYKMDSLKALEIFGYKSIIHDSKSKSIVYGDEYLHTIVMSQKSLKDCINKIEERITEYDKVSGDVIVDVFWSENSAFTKGELLTFQSANAKFGKLESNVRELKNKATEEEYISYDKTKLRLFINESGIWKSAVSRYDIGDGSAENLMDFVRQEWCNRKDIVEKCEKELMEKSISCPSRGSKEEKIK